MKSTLRILLMVFMLPVCAHAQEANTFSLPRFGLGMKIVPFVLTDFLYSDIYYFFPADASTIALPINATNHFRIEPELGFSSSTFDDVNGDKTTFTGVHFGTFVGGMWQVDNFNVYVGPRFQIMSFFGNGSDDVTGILVGAALGGEYYFGKHFSTGVEFHLNDSYLNDSGSENKYNTISTGAAFTARIYFK